MRRTVSESLVVPFLIALGGALVAGVIAVSDSPIVIAHARHVPLRVGVVYQTEALISWPHVLITSAISGVVVLLAIWSSIWLWHFVSYQLRRYKDNEWDAGEAWLQHGTATFLLRPKIETPIALPTRCRVEHANAPTRVYDEITMGLVPMIDHLNASMGRYRVRWYGSTKRGKPYEITRATFDLKDDGQHFAN